MKSWLIYGANGYSGRLIAAEAARGGLRPVLAGRGEQVGAFAHTLGLAARRFDLADRGAVACALTDVALVLNCAGPFSRTAAPMMEACLAAGVHYLDITGEYPVLERARAMAAQAEARQVVLCPGVGFDVIPTDCLALALKHALPDATDLVLGFDTGSGLSHGTARTIVEQLPGGGCIRRDGRLVAVPSAYHARRIDFGFGPKWAMTIPWGDIATAYASTGIPNISIYFPTPRAAIRLMRWTDWSRVLLGLSPVQRLLAAMVDRWVTGPTAEQRATLRTAVWGEVRNARGEIRTGRIETSNGYDLTIAGALAIVKWLLVHKVAGGYYTPSTLIGPELVQQLPGCGAIRIT